MTHDDFTSGRNGPRMELRAAVDPDRQGVAILIRGETCQHIFRLSPSETTKLAAELSRLAAKALRDKPWASQDPND